MYNEMSPNILRLCQCLASVTNDVVVRVLNLMVYYFVTRMGMHVGHNSKPEGIIS